MHTNTFNDRNILTWICSCFASLANYYYVQRCSVATRKCAPTLITKTIGYKNNHKIKLYVANCSKPLETTQKAKNKAKIHENP